MAIHVVREIRGPADVEALEQAPYAETVTTSNVYEIFCGSAARDAEATAITFLPTGAVDEDPVIINYGQLLGRIRQTANMLHDLGVGPNDVVSNLLPVLPQSHFALWGSEVAGISNPINFLLSGDQIANLLNTAETKVLFAFGPHPALDIWEKIENIRDRVPSLEAVIQIGGPGDPERGVPGFDELVAKYPADHLVSGRQITGDDIAAYFHTGGTTGSPKLAQHTHAGQVYTAWVMTQMYGLTPTDTLINGLPLFHVGGSLDFGLGTLAAGANMIHPTAGGLRTPLVVQNHWKLVEKYRPTIIGGVPTSIAALTAVPLDGADISSVKYAVTGGSPIPEETTRTFEKLCGVAIHQLFGMTESTGIASVVPSAGKAVLGSAGIRLPYEQWRVAKIDADGVIGEDCGPDEAGVLMIKGPQVSPGYKDSGHNKGTFTDDGWLISGDLSRIDNDGYLFITGRSKDVIIRGAHNIDPAIIEEAIDQHPDVMLSAAVGMPDDYAGELPVAFVTLNPEAKSTEAEILEFVANKIPERPAMPKEIFIIDDMPMTAVGKIFKPTLRWLITEKVFATRLDGVANATVTVAEDRKLGTLATVTVKDEGSADRASVAQSIADRLGGFNVAHEIVWAET